MDFIHVAHPAQAGHRRAFNMMHSATVAGCNHFPDLSFQGSMASGSANSIWPSDLLRAMQCSKSTSIPRAALPAAQLIDLNFADLPLWQQAA
jgi:hypothetical protein